MNKVATNDGLVKEQVTLNALICSWYYLFETSTAGTLVLLAQVWHSLNSIPQIYPASLPPVPR